LAVSEHLGVNISSNEISPGVKCQVPCVQAMNDFKYFNILILIIMYVM